MKTNDSFHMPKPVIAIICDDPVILQQMAIRFCSLGRITQLDSQSNGRPAPQAAAPQAAAPQAPADLIISCVTKENGLDQHHQARKTALSGSARWLAATLLNQRYLIIHGFVHSLSAPCCECVVRCIRNQLALHKELASPEQSAVAYDRAVALTALLLNHVLISPASPASSPVRLYDIEEMSSLIPLVGRIPGCEDCWPSPQPSKLRAHLGALYEECSRNQVNVEDSEGALSLSVEIASQIASRETAAEIVLPVSSVLYQQRDHLHLRGLRTVALANLLFLSFGKWDTVMHVTQDRVLPSAGNLGSAKCCVIIVNWDEIPSGAYLYEEERHVLSPVGPISKRLLLELAVVDIVPGAPFALLVVVGQFGRIGAKYGPFGYRLTHFDCGMAISQLQATLSIYGVSATELAAWPEHLLARCLCLSMSNDAIMSVFMLGSSITTQLPGAPSHSATVADTAASVDVWSIVDRLNTESREQIAKEWNSTRRSAFLTDSEAGDNLRQRSPYTSRDDLWSQLLTRRSVRSFSDKQIPKETINGLMRDISARLPARGHLTICATIRTSAGLDQEWRTYEIDGAGPSLISTLKGQASFDEVFIDPHAALAPIVLWFCGDVRGTPLEYRRTLINVGRSALDACRAASLCGLAGYHVGGFRPHLAARGLGLRLCTRAPLLAFACGNC